MTQNSGHTPIDLSDYALVAAIQSAPMAPFESWAQRLGVSATTVARRYHQLHEEGVVRVIGRTSPTFGGRMTWIMRIQHVTGFARPLAAELTGMDVTRWVRVSRVEDEVFCGVVESDVTIGDVVALVKKRVPSALVDAHQMVRMWPRGNTAAQDSAVTSAVTAGEETPETTAEEPAGEREMRSERVIDSLDDRLLAALAADGRRPNTTLARELGIDAATVSRRRKRLEAAGILYYEVMVANHVLGSGADYHAWMHVAPGSIAQLGAHLTQRADIAFVAATAGRFNLIANITLNAAKGGGLVDVTGVIDSLAPFGISTYELVPMGLTAKGYVYA